MALAPALETGEGGARKHPEDEAFGIRIAADGTWYHDGRPILRPALVKLLASALRREADGRYWLVTPVERGPIAVDDAPFVAVAMTVTGDGPGDQQVVFTTNLGEAVTVDGDHPIRVAVDPVSAEPRPYVTLDGGLEALIARPVFYDLVAHGVERQTETGREVGLWSARLFFVLGTLPPETDDRRETEA